MATLPSRKRLEPKLTRVRKVLEGTMQYDALSASEQALVRAAWLERMQALRESLNLEQEFRMSGYRYAEITAPR